jgi:hypothetical protein
MEEAQAESAVAARHTRECPVAMVLEAAKTSNRSARLEWDSVELAVKIQSSNLRLASLVPEQLSRSPLDLR